MTRATAGRAPALFSFIALAAVTTLPALVGCNNDSGSVVTAESSKYRAADGSGASGGDESSKSGTATDDPSSNKTADGGTTGAGRSGQDDPGDGRATPDSASTDTPPSKPPTQPGNVGDPITVPDGMPDELLKFITMLQKSQPRGATRDQQRADYIEMQEAIVTAADRIMASEADDATRNRAAHSKLDALRTLIELEVPGVNGRIADFCAVLRKDKSPELAVTGRLMSFLLDVDAVADSEDGNAEKVIEELTAILAEEKKDEQVFTFAQMAIQRFLGSQRSPDAGRIMRVLGEAYQAHENEQLADAARDLLEYAPVAELDLPNQLQALMRDEPDAAQQLLASVQQLLAAGKPGETTLSVVAQVAEIMERTGHYEAGGKVLDGIEVAFRSHDDEKLAATARDTVERLRKHLAIVGKPFAVEGVLLDGTKFDWGQYKGKVVLIDFWASWCGPCIAELPNIQQNYELYHDKGFEVVGVNLDDSRKDVDDFLADFKLPWNTVISADPEAQGFDNPLAVACGIDSIPFIVLVNREGVAEALHVRGDELGERLAKLLGPAGDADNLEDEKTDADEDKTDDAPSGGEAGDATNGDQGAATAPPRADRFVWQRVAATLLPVLFLQADAQPAADAQNDNPYLPDPDLSPDELVEFLLDMQEKPRSIRERPGFAEALVAAADRVLATQTTDANHIVAAETAFNTLHEKACLGDEKADQRLMEFVDLLKDDKREAIARQVTFFQMERKAIEAYKLSREEIPAAIDPLVEYLAGQTLTPRHLRFASSLVKAVNQLDEESDPQKRNEYGELREKYFDRLGKVLAGSDDKQVVAYGRKLVQSSEQPTVDLVGKPLAIEGVTALGAEFNWSAYRGKVVLVDFWATWCGPCRRQMPEVKDYFQKHKDAGFDIVGINLDSDTEALAKYLDENQIEWEQLVGEAPKKLAKDLGVRGIPTLVLVDRDGTVIATSHKAEEILPQATRLLEGAPAAESTP